jgi:hypothetical protein
MSNTALLQTKHATDVIILINRKWNKKRTFTPCMVGN